MRLRVDAQLTLRQARPPAQESGERWLAVFVCCVERPSYQELSVAYRNMFSLHYLRNLQLSIGSGVFQ
jgi:hypothetical protein